MKRIVLGLAVLFGFSVQPLCSQETGDLKQLVNELKTGEAVKKRKAVKQIVSMGNSAKAATPTLVALLEKERDPLVRRGITQALGVCGGDAKLVLPALAMALNDVDVEVKSVAAVSLSKYGKRAVPVLQTALADKDNQVRRYAAEAIILIGPDAKDAVPDLIKAYQADGPTMRRGNATVKATYVQALGAIGPAAKAAIPIFETFLQEKTANRELRPIVNDALRKIKQ